MLRLPLNISVVRFDKTGVLVMHLGRTLALTFLSSLGLLAARRYSRIGLQVVSVIFYSSRYNSYQKGSVKFYVQRKSSLNILFIMSVLTVLGRQNP